MDTGTQPQEIVRPLSILLRKLEEAKSRNPSFSLRAFSVRLGLSSGALSEIMKGKRPLTSTVKRRIGDKLLLSPQETLEFFQADLPNPMGISADTRVTLDQDNFQMISEWWYFGLLNLIKIRGFKNQAQWMARRLGLSVNLVVEAWERLFRLGYLEKVGAKIIRKHPNLKTTDNLFNLSIQKSHINDLTLIEKSILNVPVDLRDNTSCTFVIDLSDLPHLKEVVRIFQRQLLEKFGKETGDEVYKMSLAVYPLTKATGDLK